MKKFLAIFLILLIMPILAYSQITEYYVIGVSPPEKGVCVIPGQTANETFIVTSNSSTPETLDVRIFNVSWAYADDYITVPAEGRYELDVYASPPAHISPGLYDAEVYICTIPPKGVLAVATCLRAIYHVNVTYSCEMPDVTVIDMKRVIQFAAIGIIAVLSVLLLYRKFGSTYLKKKKK